MRHRQKPVGMIVEADAYREVFGQSLNALAFTLFLPVEALGVELVVKAQSLDFTV